MWVSMGLGEQEEGEMREEEKRGKLTISNLGWGQMSPHLCFGKIFLAALDYSKVSRPPGSDRDFCEVTQWDSA